MRDLVCVHGTWSRAASWHAVTGDLAREAIARDFVYHDFLWSGLLAGVPTTLPGDPREAANGADDGMLLPWLSEGEKLRLFCQQRGLERPCVFSHSHGVQVVTFAAVKGQAFEVAVSASGPIRRDMLRARRIAQGHIDRWIQFADPNADRTIVEGELFDGVVGAHFKLPEGTTIDTPGLGHSGLVTSAAARMKYRLWDAFNA